MVFQNKSPSSASAIRPFERVPVAQEVQTRPERAQTPSETSIDPRVAETLKARAIGSMAPRGYKA